MNNYGCRHTFTKGRVTNLQRKHCVVCAQPLLLLSSIHRCISCQCAAHVECYALYIDLLHQAAEAVRGVAAVGASVETDPPVVPPPTTTAPPSFVGFLQKQRDALMSHLPEAPPLTGDAFLTLFSHVRGDKHRSNDGGAEDATLATASSLASGEVTSASIPVASPAWWSPPTFASPAPCTRHRLRPQWFLFPRLCGSCLSRKTSEEQADVLKVARASRPASVVDRIAQNGLPTALVLGLGTTGYICTECDLSLHEACLYTLKAGDYAVEAPPATEVEQPSASLTAPSTTAVEAMERTLTNFLKFFTLSSAAASVEETVEGNCDNTISAKWSTGKAFLSAYFNAERRRAELDPNVEHILESTLDLVDLLQQRYPDVLSYLLNPMHMQARSQEHQRLYAACCESLSDAPILLSEESNKATERLATPCKGNADTANALTFQPITVDGVAVLRAAPTATSHLTPFGAARPSAVMAPTAPPVSTTKRNVSHHPVLQHLREALRFATAAYGETYQQGLLSSLFTSALVFTVSKSQVSASQALNDKAVTDVLALPQSALQLSRWSTVATEPSYALLVDHVTKCIVVTFRGTLTDADILTDLCATGELFCGGMAHQGAARVVNTIFDCRASRSPPQAAAVPGAEGNGGADTHTASLPTPQLAPVEKADALLDTLLVLADRHPTYGILVTGHSLGGGVAALFGTRLSHERGAFPEHVIRRVQVVAFAPMPTLSLPAAASVDEDGPDYAFPIWNIVNGCDTVPRLQLNSINRAGAIICTNHQPGSTVSDDVEMEEVGPSPQHRQCGAATAATTKFATDISVELHHPGRVFLLTTPWAPETNRLVEVPRSHVVMHDIFMMKPMIALHMMDNYMEGLRTVWIRETG